MRLAFKEKKEFVKWAKCSKYSHKNLVNQKCKYANKEYNKFYKKAYIFWFHDSYTFLTKVAILQSYITVFSSGLKKNESYVT